MSYIRRGGLGDSAPAIEQKVGEYLGKVAALNYLSVYDYSPTQIRARRINEWFIEKSGTPVWDGHNVSVAMNDYAPLQRELKDFLKGWGYDDGAAGHIAALTSLSYVSPMVSGGVHPSDVWVHAWGTSQLTDALSAGDAGQYKALRNAVIGSIAEVQASFLVIPPPSGYYWVPSAGDKNGSRIESKTAYDALYNFVWQRILLLLQQTARTETANETAIRDSISAKFQALLGRAPTAQEMSEWFLKIRDGGKTVSDLDVFIRTTAEYIQRNAPPPPPPASTTTTTTAKQSSILDFLKSPIGLGVAAIGAILVIRQVSKKKKG
jgi:hypothetical protein